MGNVFYWLGGKEEGGCNDRCLFSGLHTFKLICHLKGCIERGLSGELVLNSIKILSSRNINDYLGKSSDVAKEKNEWDICSGRHQIFFKNLTQRGAFLRSNK